MFIISEIKCVIFDCDGVLVDSVSSWRTLHEHFGTENHGLLEKFIAGELTDQEFMSLDIKMWKSVQPKIHHDDLFRIYSGIKLMPGARDLVSKLISKGIFVAIVSAGVDIFVSTIAGLLKVNDWIANGFKFDEDGYLLDEGIDNAINRHYQAHLLLKDGLANLGLELLVKEEDRLPSLNAVKIPKGIDDISIRTTLLNDYCIEIGGGLGPLANKIWRIGLMGETAKKENIYRLIDALRKILN